MSRPVAILPLEKKTPRSRLASFLTPSRENAGVASLKKTRRTAASSAGLVKSVGRLRGGVEADRPRTRYAMRLRTTWAGGPQCPCPTREASRTARQERGGGQTPKKERNKSTYTECGKLSTQAQIPGILRARKMPAAVNRDVEWGPLP